MERAAKCSHADVSSAAQPLLERWLKAEQAERSEHELRSKEEAEAEREAAKTSQKAAAENIAAEKAAAEEAAAEKAAADKVQADAIAAKAAAAVAAVTAPGPNATLSELKASEGMVARQAAKAEERAQKAAARAAARDEAKRSTPAPAPAPALMQPKKRVIPVPAQAPVDESQMPAQEREVRQMIRREQEQRAAKAAGVPPAPPKQAEKETDGLPLPAAGDSSATSELEAERMGRRTSLERLDSGLPRTASAGGDVPGLLGQWNQPTSKPQLKRTVSKYDNVSVKGKAAQFAMKEEAAALALASEQAVEEAAAMAVADSCRRRSVAPVSALREREARRSLAPSPMQPRKSFVPPPPQKRKPIRSDDPAPAADTSWDTAPDEPAAAAPSPAPHPASSNFRTLGQLQAGELPAGGDALKKEAYLTDAEFEAVFAMGKGAFAKLPAWKVKNLKQKQRLF